MTVTAVDDAAIEANPHACLVSITTNGSSAAEYVTPLYDPADVNASVTENDFSPVYTAGVSISPTVINVAEGGATDSFDIALTSEPSNTVVISSAGDGQCTVTNGTSLSFNSGNWSSAQTVSVTANDDSAVEGVHSCTIIVSLDTGNTLAAEYLTPVYNPTDVSGNITDNDSTPVYTAGVSVTPNLIYITEGGSAGSFNLVLNYVPSDNVILNSAATSGQCSISSGAQVTFTPSNWNTAQTVNVLATDDSVVEGNHTCVIEVSVDGATPASEYSSYNPSDVTASITDNDIVATATSVVQPAIIITETDASTWVSEAGGTDVFYLSLSTLPTQNVEILISTDGQCVVDDTQKTFTQNSWNSLKSVQVSAVNDGVDEWDTHTCAINMTTIDAYSANEYHPVTANLTANVSDNDSANPGVIINPSSMVMNEGQSGAFQVKLQSQPSQNVLIQATSSNTGVCTVSPAEFTLTSNSWNVGKNFTVSGVYNDSGANLACDIYLKIISYDAAYHLINTPTFTTVINSVYSQAPTATPYPVYPTYTPRPTFVPWASSTPWATSTSIARATSTPFVVTATNTPDPNATLLIPTNTPIPQPTQSARSGPSLGVVAIIVVSTLILFGAVGVGAYFIIQKYF